MTVQVPIPTQSIRHVDLLLGYATMLAAERFDAVAALLHEAMAIAMYLSFAHAFDTPVDDLIDRDHLSVKDCVDQALTEVFTWDLALAGSMPDLARLRVVLIDLRDALATEQG